MLDLNILEEEIAHARLKWADTYDDATLITVDMVMEELHSILRDIRNEGDERKRVSRLRDTLNSMLSAVDYDHKLLKENDYLKGMKLTLLTAIMLIRDIWGIV